MARKILPPDDHMKLVMSGYLLTSRLIMTFCENDLFGTVIKSIYLNENDEIVVDFVYSECSLCKKLFDIVVDLAGDNNGQNYDDFVRQIKDICSMILSKERLADNLFFEVLNTQNNIDILSNLPYREFLDLAFVPNVLIEKNKNDLESFRVTNTMIHTLGLDDEFLLECAEKNTPHILPLFIREYTDQNTFGGHSIVDTDNEQAVTQQVGSIVSNTKGLKMWNIYSSIRNTGVAFIKYLPVLQAFANACNDDLVIVPMSCHELTVIPKSIATSFLCTLFYRARKKCIPEEYKISDNFYFFDRKKKVIQITPHIT